MPYTGVVAIALPKRERSGDVAQRKHEWVSTEPKATDVDDRSAAVRRAWDAMVEAVAQIPSEEREKLEREIIEETDEAIRRRIAMLGRRDRRRA